MRTRRLFRFLLFVCEKARCARASRRSGLPMGIRQACSEAPGGRDQAVHEADDLNPHGTLVLPAKSTVHLSRQKPAPALTANP